MLDSVAVAVAKGVHDADSATEILDETEPEAAGKTVFIDGNVTLKKAVVLSVDDSDSEASVEELPVSTKWTTSAPLSSRVELVIDLPSSADSPPSSESKEREDDASEVLSLSEPVAAADGGAELQESVASVGVDKAKFVFPGNVLRHPYFDDEYFEGRDEDLENESSGKIFRQQPFDDLHVETDDGNFHPRLKPERVCRFQEKEVLKFYLIWNKFRQMPSSRREVWRVQFLLTSCRATLILKTSISRTEKKDLVMRLMPLRRLFLRKGCEPRFF